MRNVTLLIKPFYAVKHACFVCLFSFESIAFISTKRKKNRRKVQSLTYEMKGLFEITYFCINEFVISRKDLHKQ